MKNDSAAALSGLAPAASQRHSEELQFLGTPYNPIPMETQKDMVMSIQNSVSSVGAVGYEEVMPPMLPTPSHVVDAPPTPAPVSAYAKLESPDFVYYVQQLVIEIGHNLNLENPRLARVDVDLYEYEGIAPKHATIAYDFEDEDFKLTAHAPLYINGKIFNPDTTGISLRSTDILQVGGCQFFFLLPVTSMPVPPPSTAQQQNLSMQAIAAYPIETEHYETGQYLESERACLGDAPIPSASQNRGSIARGGMMTGMSSPTIPSQGAAQVVGINHGAMKQDAMFEPIPRGVAGNASSQVVPGSSSSCNVSGPSRNFPGSGPAAITEEKPQGAYQKPPMSYIALIAEAICRSEEKKLTLNGIYHSITKSYPYYRFTPSGWRNSIRHNLSLNPCFSKLPRHKDQIGKGGYWVVSEEFEEMFRGGNFKRRQRRNSTSKVVVNETLTSELETSAHTEGTRRINTPQPVGLPTSSVTEVPASSSKSKSLSQSLPIDTKRRPLGMASPKELASPSRGSLVHPITIAAAVAMGEEGKSNAVVPGGSMPGVSHHGNAVVAADVAGEQHYDISTGSMPTKPYSSSAGVPGAADGCVTMAPEWRGGV